MEQSSNEPAKTAAVDSTVPNNEGTPADKTTEVKTEVAEEYDLELTEDSPLSEEDLNEIAEEASRLSLSKDDAQKLITAREKSYKNGLTKAQADQQAKIDAARKTIASDPMFATEAAAQESFASMTRAIETFGDLEMVELVKSPEFGNSVVLARFLKKLGDALKPADDAQAEMQGGNGTSIPVKEDGDSTLKTLYPSFFQDKK